MMVAVTQLDPLLALLSQYAGFRDALETVPDDDAAAFWEANCAPIINRLTAGDIPPATSAAGAAAALRLALDADDMEDQDGHLVRAALVFLDAAPSICAAPAPDPDMTDRIAYWRGAGGRMVPIVESALSVRLVSHRRLENVAVPDPLPVAHYITNLELLGFRFEVYGPPDARRWGTALPDPPLPPWWEAYALRLEAAMDRAARRDEIVAFLLARQSAAGGSA